MSGGSGSFLEIQPSELAFPFEIMRQSSCSMQLTNKTDHYVAFKVKTTNPKQYCVRPNIGVVLPGSTCDVTVTMQAQKASPPDMLCKDKFLVQSVAAENGATAQDINAAMFNKEPGKVVDEFKLRVVYVPTTTPNPIPEESELGSSTPSFLLQENGTSHSTMLLSVSRSSAETTKEKPSEGTKAPLKTTSMLLGGGANWRSVSGSRLASRLTLGLSFCSSSPASTLLVSLCCCNLSLPLCTSLGLFVLDWRHALSPTGVSPGHLWNEK